MTPPSKKATSTLTATYSFFQRNDEAPSATAQFSDDLCTSVILSGDDSVFCEGVAVNSSSPSSLLQSKPTYTCELRRGMEIHPTSIEVTPFLVSIDKASGTYMDSFTFTWNQTSSAYVSAVVENASTSAGCQIQKVDPLNLKPGETAIADPGKVVIMGSSLLPKTNPAPSCEFVVKIQRKQKVKASSTTLNSVVVESTMERAFLLKIR